MTDPNETANLVNQLTRGYREHVADGKIAAVSRAGAASAPGSGSE